MAETKRLKIPELSSSEKVSEGPAKINSGFSRIDEIDWGQQDYLQAGVPAAEDWELELEINSSSGVLASKATTGGVAWLPDPEEAARLMRSVTSSAKLTGLTPGTLPTTGKFMCIGLELAASSWGGAATASVKSGTEKNSQAEAEAASPAVSSGKIRVRDVVVKNTSGVYSIVAQNDRRVYALNGERLANFSVTGPKLGEGTVQTLATVGKLTVSFGSILYISEKWVKDYGTSDWSVSGTKTKLITVSWTTDRKNPYIVIAGDRNEYLPVDEPEDTGFTMTVSEAVTPYPVNFFAIGFQ